ncbi:hypothetical protein [Fervidobacterium islandicum]|uniref:hypothetical protein n=1 Tax=Fervidobacterium islandicum TaxID=2423 RepID=UPI003A6FFF9C
MRSGGFKRIVLVFLFSVLFSTSFAHLVIPAIPEVYFTGAYPLPESWLSNQLIPNNTVKLELNFSLYTASWPTTVTTKYSGWWGVPANPAENIFYLPEEIPPFVNLVLDYKLENLALYLELPFEKEYRNKLVTLSEHTNLPFSLFNPLDMSKLSVDLNFPRIGYIYFACDNLYLSVGRFPLKWGDAKYPVHISPTTYQDNTTLALKFPGMTYTFHAITSYPLLSPQEYAVQSNYSDQHTAGRYFNEPSKWIIAHRFDFYNTFGDANLRVGFGELNVVGGKYLDLTDFSPILIYHNTYGEGYSNVTGSIDFTLKWNEHTFYGELVLDDMKTLTELQGSYKPEAYAWDLGYAFRTERTELWIEYSYTSEWMYVTNYLPYLKINVRHFDLENNPSGRLLLDYPLGFIYGPDTKMLSFGLKGNFLGVDLEAVYNMLTKGLVDDNGTIRWKWFWDGWPGNVAEPGATTPLRAGEENYNIFSLKVSWNNLTFFYKTVDLNNYFLSVNYKTTF